jgi:hypothetical protein
MPRSARALRVSERLYKALIVAYPKGFRREYRAQLEQVFRDLCQEELQRDEKCGLWRLWVRTILDLGTTAWVERMSDLSRSNGKEVSVNDYKLAGAGLILLLLSPLFFVAASLLKYELGIGFLFDPLEALLSDPERLRVFNLVSPVVFLGGLLLALILNAYAVLRLNVGREDGAIVSTVRLETKFWNIAVVAVSLLLLATLVGYIFVENLVYRP